MTSRLDTPMMTNDANPEDLSPKPQTQAPTQLDPANSGDKRSASSPQTISKSTTKIKDLEKLLAKCKESLKLKNSQIQTLKDSLSEVERFKEFNESLRSELSDLRRTHESWTVSVAESKLVLHQEIESKNAEIEALKNEINDLQLRLNDSNNKSRQLRSAIQDLESRIVSTSANHQRERDNLSKEMNVAKTAAIKQLQKEHKHNLERVKLDLEKTIESLKQDILKRDEKIVKDAELQQQLTAELDQCKIDRDNQAKQLLDIKTRFEDLQTSTDSKRDEQESKNIQLIAQIEALTSELDQSKKTITEFEEKFNKLESKVDICDRCQQLNNEAKRNAEIYEQSLFELNTQIDLMTTANTDQEKEIEAIKVERDNANDTYRTLKSEYDELLSKNEALGRAIRDNETDMQNQLEQLEYMSTIKQELDSLKKENSNLSTALKQSHSELCDRDTDLTKAKSFSDEMANRLSEMESQINNFKKIVEDLTTERNSLASAIKESDHRRRKLDEQLVISILSAMRNLDTPNASPGSDKTYEPEQVNSHSTDSSTISDLPDILNLTEQLASVALDRGNSTLATTQRLQAVLLENSMIAEELARLKDELHNLNREMTLETQFSLEETERLKTENQALIHDQKSYDDRINSLEAEIESLNSQLADRTENGSSDHTYQIRALERVLKQYQEENQKLKESHKALTAQIQDNPELSQVPDSTQFEYLKNIIYQFMLGKEPLVLAKVISAILKFEGSQVEQICKMQEAVQVALRQHN